MNNRGWLSAIKTTTPPIFLRNILPLNTPKKNDNLVTLSLNPAYEQPDARPTTGINIVLVAEQEQSG